MPVAPRPAVQTCSGCRKKLTLAAGSALDTSVVAPPPHPTSFRIYLKWSIVVTYRFAALEPEGIHSGTLDPVVGIAPVDQTQIAYRDVLSIAIWRTIGWTDCIVGALVPAPLAFFSAWGAGLAAMHREAGVGAVLGAIAVGAVLIAWWLLRRGIVIGRRRARVVGRWASTTVPFETQALFHPELFRRCGLPCPPIP